MDKRKFLIPTVLAGGGAGATPYSDILVDTYGASEVWSLVDIESGTTIHAKVAGARDGTLQGWDLQNAAGPVTGTLAPYAEGDYGSLDTASLRSLFNGGIGGIFGWTKVPSAVWTDSTTRFMYRFAVDGNNDINMLRLTTNETIRFQYKAGGTGINLDIGSLTYTDWFSFGMSWKDSVNGDEFKAFINGLQVGSTQTGIGTWAGTPVQLAITAQADNAATNPWKGHVAYFAVKYGAIWTPDDFENMHSAANP